MPLTPDRRPGELIEDDGIELVPQATHPAANGELRYVDGLGFRFYEEGVEKGLGGAASAIHTATLDVTVEQGCDEVKGTVTGLPAAPAKVTGTVVGEQARTVQSGIPYTFNVQGLTADGFHWRLALLNNEYWPGPGSVTIRVHIVWSEA